MDWYKNKLVKNIIFNVAFFFLLIFLCLFLNQNKSEANIFGTCDKSFFKDSENVFFFKTKGNYAAGGEIKNNWYYSGRTGNFQDCKKFWSTNGDTNPGFIRSWEDKAVVSKKEYCSAKYFHNWFGFGDQRHLYCGSASVKNSLISETTDETIVVDISKVYLPVGKEKILCKAIGGCWANGEVEEDFKYYLTGSNNKALAFNSSRVLDGPAYGYSGTGRSELSTASKEALEGCEKHADCIIVMENNEIVHRQLSKKVISLLSIEDKKIMAMDDKSLCAASLNKQGSNWIDQNKKNHVFARGYNRLSCNLLTEREIIVENEIKNNNLPDDEMNIYFTDRLCNLFNNCYGKKANEFLLALNLHNAPTDNEVFSEFYVAYDPLLEIYDIRGWSWSGEEASRLAAVFSSVEVRKRCSERIKKIKDLKCVRVFVNHSSLDYKKLSQRDVENRFIKLLSTLTKNDSEISVASNESEEDNVAPVIEMKEKFTVTDRSFSISGRVTDDNDAFIEAIGSSWPVVNHTFTIKGFTPFGLNEIEVIAFDTAGNESSKKITIERVMQTVKQTNDFEILNPNKIKSKNKKNRIALIIGIEEYENISNANYAKRDAELFIDYAQTVFGVHQSNIKYFFNSDAKRDSKFEMKKWFKTNIRANTEVYIYFSGHGLADKNGQELYLLTNDTLPEFFQDTALNRNEIFNDIAKYNPKSVTAFLDTCYSGAGRADGEILLAMAKGLVVVDEQQQQLPDNFTLFTAASAQESAWSLPEAQHGTFSYFLMKGMEGEADLDGNKKLTNGELQEYLLDNVSRYAQQQQTPQMIGDPDQVLVRF